MPNTNEFEDSSQQSRDKLLDPSPLKENRLVKAGLFYKKNAYPSFSDPHCYGHEKRKRTGLDCYNYSFKNEKEFQEWFEQRQLGCVWVRERKTPPRVQLISNTKAISATNPDLIFKKA